MQLLTDDSHSQPIQIHVATNGGCIIRFDSCSGGQVTCSSHVHSVGHMFI